MLSTVKNEAAASQRIGFLMHSIYVIYRLLFITWGFSLFTCFASPSVTRITQHHLIYHFSSVDFKALSNHSRHHSFHFHTGRGKLRAGDERECQPKDAARPLLRLSTIHALISPRVGRDELSHGIFGQKAQSLVSPGPARRTLCHRSACVVPWYLPWVLPPFIHTGTIRILQVKAPFIHT